MHTRLLCDRLRASIAMSGSDGDIKSRRPASAFFQALPRVAAQALCLGRQMIPRYSCSGSQQDRQTGRQAGRPLQWIANSCTAYAGCMASSLRDGTAVRAVKAARAWPRTAQAGPLGHTGTSTSSQAGREHTHTHTHMMSKQCTLLMGAGRFVGLRCNITQYLHVIIDTRTYEHSNVF